MPAMAVRVVDISSWTSEGSREGSREANFQSRSTCSSEVAQALEETGMVVVKGHGIPADVVNALKAKSLRWFQETKDKEAFIRGPYGCEDGGYTAIGVEAVAASTEGKQALDHIDAVESFVFRGQPSKKFVGDGAPSITSEAEAYYIQLVNLLKTMHAIICSSLGVPGDHFYANGIMPATDIHSLKLSYYPPFGVPSVPPSAISRRLRYGAHTDFQDITILRPDINDWTALSGDAVEGEEIPTTGGLQVYTREDTWEAVVIHDDDALCLNLGDFWETWSNGRFRSPLHRVTASGYPLSRAKAKAPVMAEAAAEQPRFSAIFFSVPADSAIVEPLPGTPPISGLASASKNVVDGDGKCLSAGEHLAVKLARINS